jgi:hypothetical protein
MNCLEHFKRPFIIKNFGSHCITGIQLMRALQRHRGFAALALAEAMNHEGPNDTSIQKLQPIDIIIKVQDLDRW